MDGLIELGRRSVKDMEKSNHFQPSPRTCSIIEVWPNAGQATSMTRIDANESQLRRELQHQGERESGPLFKLVCIWRDEDETLHSSQPIFLLTFDQLGLSPASLYLISRNCYGLHVFDDEDLRRTFFVGTVMYALVWTHDSHTSCTRALLLLRTGCGLSEGDAILDELVSILELYESHVGNQHYLQYVVGLHISRFVDESIQVELEFIRNMESRTGYGSWTSGRPSLPQPDVRKLAEWSAKIGASVVNLANQVRHADISRSLVSFIQGDVQRGQPSRHSSSRPSDLSALLPTLEKQIASQLSYISYLQERAKSLSTVVRWPPTAKLTPRAELTECLDFCPSGPRGCPRRPLHCGQVRTGQLVHENHCRYDHGLPARHLLRCLVCHSFARLGAV